MILIVDDRKENLLSLKKILELNGFLTDEAESGEEALRKILKKEYSLIILDVQMPGMDGFEVAEALASTERTCDIPVIFLSAISKEKRYISKGYASGGVDYITKPVDPDLLVLKVKAFCKLYEQQKELKAVKEMLSKEIQIRIKAQDSLEEEVSVRTQELTKKNEELELKNHELQQFTWVVSHDLKEPLRKIQTFNEIIKEKYVVNDAKAAEYIDKSILCSERMSNLIEDLLKYTRLSAEIIPKKTDLNIILQEVLSDLVYSIEEKQASFKIGVLPEIDCVPSQMRQVFQNLISNSLKFTAQGIAPLIEIKSERVKECKADSEPDVEGKFWRILVKDNGIGFDEKFLEKIFLIFQSLNDRKTYEGTGIGLAIVKKILEKNKGIITARSTPGHGATFIIVLPVIH